MSAGLVSVVGGRVGGLRGGVSAGAAWREPADILANDISPLPAQTPLVHRLAPFLVNLARAAAPARAVLWTSAASWPVRPSAGWTPLVVRAFGPDGRLHTAATAASAVSAGSAGSAGSAASAWSAGLAGLARRAGRPAGATVQVRDGARLVGMITVACWADDLVAPGLPAGLLERTQDCVALVLREDRLAAALGQQQRREKHLDDRRDRLAHQLAWVCDAERRRLAGWVLAGADGALTDVEGHWLACVAAFDEQRADDPGEGGPEEGDPCAALRRMRAALDVLVDDFRVVVRAVAPVTLRARGTGAALVELTAHLPRPVRFVGDLGRRVGWEVESALYHGAAAALTMMSTAGVVIADAVTAGPVADEPVADEPVADEPVTDDPGGGQRAGPGASTADESVLTVYLRRVDGRLVVRVCDPRPRDLGLVWAGLADDARRMVALGGGVRFEVTADGAAMVELWLAERFLGAGFAVGGRGRRARAPPPPR
ncbi:hypothetical protein MXD63_34680, partial [Frankia sp. Cpl3]|nr:hypothetical protein [Frankia sp. Cpl3]